MHFEETCVLLRVLAEGVAIVEVGADFDEFCHISNSVNGPHFHQSSLPHIPLHKLYQPF